MSEDNKLIAFLKDNDPAAEIADRRLARLTMSILAKGPKESPSPPQNRPSYRYDWPRIAVCVMSLVLGVVIGQMIETPYTNTMTKSQVASSGIVDIQEPELAVMAMATPWAEWMEQGE